MPRPKRTDYDAPRFRALWLSDATIHAIAAEYGVTTTAIYKAAMRRGFPPKFQMRAA